MSGLDVVVTLGAVGGVLAMFLARRRLAVAIVWTAVAIMALSGTPPDWTQLPWVLLATLSGLAGGLVVATVQQIRRDRAHSKVP